MGCDIHLFVEYKKGDNWLSADVWEQDAYGDYDVPRRHCFYHDRAYQLFSMLSDCGRGSLVPIVEPRGFPKDASKILRMFRAEYGADGHDDSWITFQELDKNNDIWKGEHIPEEWRVCLWKLWQTGFDKHVKPEEVRIVFWFDN